MSYFLDDPAALSGAEVETCIEEARCMSGPLANFSCERGFSGPLCGMSEASPAVRCAQANPCSLTTSCTGTLIVYRCIDCQASVTSAPRNSARHTM